MAENSGISWTDHTFNPWIGCTNVGPGCDHCYAENLATKRLGVGWGNNAPRRRTKPANWKKVLTWHNAAETFKAAHGHYPRVFAASLADIFDNQVDPDWRADFWDYVKETPKLQWLIVTKRIGNVAEMLPPDWGAGWPQVCLIITVVNQAEADRDIPKLLRVPAARRGLSIEPMLGPINLRRIGTHGGWYDALAGWRDVKESPAPEGRVDWVITGGESKQLEGSRPLVALEAEWVRSIAAQCEDAGVPHHFKQWGHTIPQDQMAVDYGCPLYTTSIPGRVVWREGMGRSLDGIEHNEFPA